MIGWLSSASNAVARTDIDASEPRTAVAQTDIDASEPRNASEPRTAVAQTDIDASEPRTAVTRTDMDASEPRNASEPPAVTHNAADASAHSAIAGRPDASASTSAETLELRSPMGTAASLADDGAQRKRNGFFFRFSFGFGPAWYSTRFKGQGQWSAYDQSVQYQLLAGGSLAEGFVVGGGATLNLMGNPRVKGRLDTTNHLENIVVGQLQSFVAYYPARNFGLNVLGSIGYCVLASHFSDASWGDDATGLVFAGGVGYQFQVSPRWALGFQFQLSYAVAAEAGPIKVNSATILVPSLGFATTYY